MGLVGCGFSRNIRNNPTICEQYSMPTPVIHVYHPPCQPFPCPTFPRPPLRVATPARLFRQPFQDSISWGLVGQGLISWWGPCPLEVPGRPKCGQGPRHKSRPCPLEPRGGEDEDLSVADFSECLPHPYEISTLSPLENERTVSTVEA